MKGYNLIVVYNETADKVLLCERRHNPYKGLYNFVGGKIEAGEDGISAAYRELFEETSITKENITLTHFMDFTYYTYDLYIEVYVGKIKSSCKTEGEENDLCWSSLDVDFFDPSKFARESNMGHIIMEIETQRDTLLK